MTADIRNARAAAVAALGSAPDALPEWRQAHTRISDEPDAIAPVCTAEGHEPADPSIYSCCPDPVIEVETPAIGAYLVALLNADRTPLLSQPQRRFLGFALDRAAEELSLGVGFTAEDEAALESLRALTAETVLRRRAVTGERR